MHICKLLSCFCSLSLVCGIFPEAVTQCAFVVVVNDKPRFSLDFCLNLFVVFFEPGLGSGINKYRNCYCKCIPIGQIDIFRQNSADFSSYFAFAGPRRAISLALGFAKNKKQKVKEGKPFYVVAAIIGCAHTYGNK